MIKFTKMEGLGNDYIYIYSEKTIVDISTLAIKMSDRHFGVGSDGIILISPSDVSDFKMEIYNSDGSQAEMCGNGIRCVGKYVYDNNLIDKTEIDIETLAGIKHLSLTIDNNRVSMVRVDMGIPSFNPDDISVKDYKSVISDNGDSFVKVVFDNMSFTCVSMGNPHAVCFTNSLDDLEIGKYGPAISEDERFLNRTNVEFVSVIDRDNIKMRVWERGALETLACGTGACASVCAGVLNGYLDRKVSVELLGGTLFIEWSDDGHVYMTGPARTVFIGEYDER